LTLRNTSSFLIWSIQLIFSIFLQAAYGHHKWIRSNYYASNVETFVVIEKSCTPPSYCWKLVESSWGIFLSRIFVILTRLEETAPELVSVPSKLIVQPSERKYLAHSVWRSVSILCCVR
jgi:hypothetical protein